MNARRLMGSQIIELAAHCNQILLAQLYINSAQKPSLKARCDTPFQHASTACVFRASWAKPRLISITKVKTHLNALHFD